MDAMNVKKRKEYRKSCVPCVNFANLAIQKISIAKDAMNRKARKEYNSPCLKLANTKSWRNKALVIFL